MAKKTKRWTPEERAEWEARNAKVEALLQERIDYWEARVKEKEQQEAK